MKNKIFALLCAASMLSAAAPVVSANTDSGSGTVETTASAHKRPMNQQKSENKQSFDAESADGSQITSDVVTDAGSAEVQNSAGEMVTLELIEYFRDQTENFAETIDVSDYYIPYDEGTFNQLYEMLVYSSPKSYYLLSDNGMYSYFYPEVGSDGCITYIYPIYTKFDTTDENLSIYDEDVYIVPEKLEKVIVNDKVKEKQAAFDATIADIKTHITENSSDFEKLLAFHDYIVMNYKYSWDDLAKPLSERTHNTVMSLITTGEGLCESFSVLFNYLVMDAGLDTGFLTSYDVNSGGAYHTWNMVKLSMPGSKDQSWYNIDVTWDENNVEREIGGKKHQKDEGRTDFTYFLMSDDMTFDSHAKAGEFSYKKPEMSDNKSLDTIEWKGSDSQIVDVNGTSYFIDFPEGAEKPALYKTNGDSTEKVFDDFKVLWDYSNNTAYSGLSYFNGSLYFNDAENIYEYHIGTGNVTVTAILDQLDGSISTAAAGARSRRDQIYSSYKKDDDLYFCTATVDEDDELTLIASSGNKTFNVGIDVLAMPAYNENGNIEFKLSSELNKHIITAVKASDGSIVGLSIKMNRGTMTYELAQKNGTKLPEGDLEVLMWDVDSMKPIMTKTVLKAK